MLLVSCSMESSCINPNRFLILYSGLQILSAASILLYQKIYKKKINCANESIRVYAILYNENTQNLSFE